MDFYQLYKFMYILTNDETLNKSNIVVLKF